MHINGEGEKGGVGTRVAGRYYATFYKAILLPDPRL